jgi:hypothetical protein
MTSGNISSKKVSGVMTISVDMFAGPCSLRSPASQPIYGGLVGPVRKVADSVLMLVLIWQPRNTVCGLPYVICRCFIHANVRFLCDSIRPT